MFVKRICCIGAGRVGATTSAVIALKCPEILVTAVDENIEKIMQWNSETIPIDEPGLDEVVKNCNNKNLFFSTSLAAIKEADVIFICVNVPIKMAGEEKGKADLRNVENAARLIADVGMSDKIVVHKCSGSIKTSEIISKILKANHHPNYQVLSNPTFISTGSALKDTLNPDMVLIGGDDTVQGRAALNKVIALYEHWIPRNKIITTKNCTAELAILVKSAMIAQRMSSMNTLSALCECVGSDINDIAEWLGVNLKLCGNLPKRVEKNTLSLIYHFEALGLHNIADYWKEVIDMDLFHKTRFLERIKEGLFNSLSDKKIAVLGLMYQEAKDTLDPLASFVCKGLLAEGAKLNLYEPRLKQSLILSELNIVEEDATKNQKVQVFDDPYQCVSNTHAMVFCIEWEEYKNLYYEGIFASMIKPAFIFDCKKNTLWNELLKVGYNMECLGVCMTKTPVQQNNKVYTKSVN